jgi:DNA (cytosine-5)-methyltransferase 1
MNSNGRSTEAHEADNDSKDGCALSVGSLFSGIGGLDLGFERAGFEIAWQCEKDSYCQNVLNKHWPNTPCYDNIEDLHRADGPQPEADILIGGFPCQDISYAGEGAGLNGERSGLWWEYARLIRCLGPRYVVVENVAALLDRGLKAILGWLAEAGYDAEWQVISACMFGAPHTRERLFLVAYPAGDRCERDMRETGAQAVFNRTPEALDFWDDGWGPFRDIEKCLAKSKSVRVADGVPSTVDIRPRLHAYGNAVVPQVAQFVAECVREHAARTRDPRRQTERLDADVP